MQRRQFLVGFAALALLPAIPVPSPPFPTVHEAALTVRKWRSHVITVLKTENMADAAAREGVSPTRKLCEAVQDLREAAAREGLDDDQYEAVLRGAFRAARQDAQHVHHAPSVWNVAY